MNARRALAELMKASPEYRALFRRCCEVSLKRLCAQVWQFRQELRSRGYWVDPEELEDALLALVRKVLPGSPAARWSPEWAHELCRDALAQAVALYGELPPEAQGAADLEGAEAQWIERMNVAAETNDPAAFRAAVKGWERALVGALEARRGAA